MIRLYLHCKRLGATGLLLVLSACSALKPSDAPQPAYYTLDGLPLAYTAGAARSGPTLVIGLPSAAAGYDSQRILYVREPHRLEYFAHSEWVDPPTRMIAAALLAALQNHAAFGAVVGASGSAWGELRLDTELVRLQHDFQARPSQVVLTLRATLTQDKARRVLAVRQFEARVPSASEDPRGGVQAANLALQQVLTDLSTFLSEAAANLPRVD